MQPLGLPEALYFMTHLILCRYHCHTCKMVDGVGVCTVCAKVCHKDHEISYAKYGSFFCDCGAKEDGSCLVKRLHVNIPAGIS